MIVSDLMKIGLLAAMLVSCTGNRPDNAAEKSASEADLLSKETNGGELFLLAGTYTSKEVKGSKGIYIFKFDTESGKSASIGMTEVDNPSYLVVSPDEKYIYTVSEESESKGAVHAFSFDKRNGALNWLNSTAVNSDGPCYITIDSKGKNIHTANYGGGSISSFQVNEDGTLTSAISVLAFKGSGPDTIRQEKSHLHSVMYSPDGQFLFAADLGADKLYRLTANNSPFKGQPGLLENSLVEFKMPEGTGPRHFDFHPDGNKYLYLLGELSGEVIVFDYSFGDLTQKQIIAADTTKARGSADIHVSPDGRFLYATNRLQADGIAIFSINPDDGTLTKIGYQLTGKHPRNFVISPNGKFLLVASRDDNKIQVFRIDSETGMLTETNQDISINKPVCLKFVHSAGNG